MPEIAFAVALVVLGCLAWDGWRKYLAYRARLLAVNEEIKALKANMVVIHTDLANLTEMTAKEFQRMAGKQSMQAVSASMFQPQTGGKPF
jgi:hypothetical protein